MSPTAWGWLVLACPLAGTGILGLGYKSWPKLSAGYIATFAIFGSFICSLGALITLLNRGTGHREVSSTLWNYAVTPGLDAKLQILIDPISVFMILVVSGVSTLIHLYSISYMKSDKGFVRYFAYLNFFVFSMLVLVTAGNFVLLIVGWAFVGAASYLLISFWYRRTTATQAGIKAFVINVVGDVGLVLGTFFILRDTHTVDFLKTFAVAPHVFHHNQGSLVAGCILLLVGAFAKSAQLPFHTWLPDAMEGPTPVSSLIHAATMVTAGVYLIARMHPLFELAPAAADVGTVVGCLTLLVAATIAVVQTDIKRVIAYSTMSQIGYMIMGVSSGAYAAGLFHLMTHAFFKALLFMAAGSVIGAMAGAQSIEKMSGLKKAMPFTFACFVIGSLALAGMPPFSGWLSKDDIIGYLFHRGGVWDVFGVLGYAGALMTGVYSFRLIFRVFFGEPCEEARELENGHLAHAHVPTNPANGEEEDTEIGFPGPEHVIAEREWPMRIAMGGLAIGAVIAGFLQVPGIDDKVTQFLRPAFPHDRLAEMDPSSGSAWIGLIVGALIAVVGIAIAARIWLAKPEIAVRLRERLPLVHTFLLNKWYFDELIDAVIVRPAAIFGRVMNTVGERIVITGGITGGVTGLVRLTSGGVRRGQTGFLRYYAAVMIVGLLGVVLYFLISAS